MRKIFSDLVVGVVMVLGVVSLWSCGPDTPDVPPGPPVTEPQGLVWTSPKFVTSDTTSDVYVYVNAEGTAFDGLSVDMYAHTGLITSKSSSTSDWKYVKHGWTENADDCKLVKVDENIWALTIAGGPRAFYGVPEGEQIEKLAFVFRSADGKKEIKDNGQDIFVDISEGGLAVKFVSPASGTILELGEKVTISVAAAEAEYVSLSLNGQELARDNESMAINYEYTASEQTDLCFVAEAGGNGATVSEQLLLTVLGATQDVPRPSGVGDGVTVNGTSATFVLYAPGKSRVCLLADFNNYTATNEYMMMRDGDYFWVAVEGLQPEREYGYQFLVDDVKVGDPYAKKILDPWNDKYISSSVYPNLKEYPSEYTTDIVSVFSTSTEAGFAWSDKSFERPHQNSLVIYELLVRDFTTEGTIDAVTAKLDYLETLGVNAIELMPIMEFDGNNSWGYNPCFYMAPDKAYGTPDDYKEFINECHNRGIAVILDIVLNHATGQFPWAKMWWNSSKNCTAADNPFFNVNAVHNFSVYHDFNHTYPKTRSYFKDVLQYWIEEYHIDGYRFDLTKGIVQNPSNYDASGYSSQRIGFLKEYHDAVDEVDEEAYMILEHFCATSEEDELAADGMMLWRNLNNAFCENGMGWHENNKSDFSGVSAYGRVGYAESHDEERVAYKMTQWGNTGAKSNWDNMAKRLAGQYALLILSPYPKMIWQFGELGYDVSITANSNGTVISGQDYRTDPKPVRWNYLNEPARRALYDDMCKIISFRTDNEKMYSYDDGDKKRSAWRVSASDKGGKHLVYSTPEGTVIVAGNFREDGTGNVAFDLAVPQSGEYTNLITGQKVNINGTYHVSLDPHEYVVLTKVN